MTIYVKEFHCHMRMNIQPYEENQICLALFHGTMYNLAFLNSEQDSVHKMDFTDITAAKTRKNCFKRFILRTCNFGFRSHLFLYQKFFCCHFNLKKYSFSNFCDFSISKSQYELYEYKAKVSSRTWGP